MTTIYVPRLIESAEQAEALPEGTIITHAEYHPQEKFAGLWGRDRNTNRQLAQQVGWTALVPIEADMETREHPYRVEDAPESAYLRPVPQVRYKTLWEDA